MLLSLLSLCVLFSQGAYGVLATKRMPHVHGFLLEASRRYGHLIISKLLHLARFAGMLQILMSSLLDNSHLIGVYSQSGMSVAKLA